jgi:hypothetical protein
MVSGVEPRHRAYGHQLNLHFSPFIQLMFKSGGIHLSLEKITHNDTVNHHPVQIHVLLCTT